METRNYLIIFCLLAFSVSSTAQPILEKKIDSTIAATMKFYRIKALSVSIVVEGKSFYQKGFGFTNVDSMHAVTADTKFPISSLTKLFTATAIMQLVEQGRLDLNKKLVDYIPTFMLNDTRFKDITLMHLITHSSGLGWDNVLKTPTEDSLALKEFVASLSSTKLNFAPGEKFSAATYSNTGFDILGYLIAQTSSLSFPVYIDKYILAMADMKNTTFHLKDIARNQLALPLKLYGDTKEINRFNLYGEMKDKNPLLKYPTIPIVEWIDYSWGKPEHNPSGYLFSTANDLSKWIIGWLQIYNGNSSNLLSASSVKDMWSLKRSIENKKTSIGLGWWRFDDSLNGNYVFHVGRSPGYSSTLRIYPDRNIGITILTNAMYADQIVWNELPELIMKIIGD